MPTDWARLIFAFLLIIAATAFSRAEEPRVLYKGEVLAMWVAKLNGPQLDDHAEAVRAIRALSASDPDTIRALLLATRDAHSVAGEVDAAFDSLNARAVPGLIAALWQDHSELQIAAMHYLSRLGSAARAAAPTLLAKLQSEDHVVRMSALNALVAIGDPLPEDAIESILNTPLPIGRAAAVAALVRLPTPPPQAIKALLTALQDEDALVRRVSADTAGRLRYLATEAIVAELVNLLNDDELQVRRTAAASLGRFGPRAEPSVEEIAAHLKVERDAECRVLIAKSLWVIDEHQSAPDHLEKLLNEPEIPENIRINAAEALWHMNRPEPAIASLGKLIEREPNEVKVSALRAVEQIGPSAGNLLPIVLPLTGHHDSSVRACAIDVLGRFGTAAKPAMSRVRYAAENDDNEEIRIGATLAMWRIERDLNALRTFTKGLQRNDYFRRYCIQVVGSIGPPASDAVNALRAILTDDDIDARIEAAGALWLIRKDPAPLQLLVDNLRNTDDRIRSSCALALGIYVDEKDKRPAVAALRDALWDSNSYVRSSAAESLGRIGSDASNAIGPLTALLADDREANHLHSATAEALGLIGPQAASALPVIRNRLKHDDGYVRACAALALWNIDGSRAGEAVAEKSLADRNLRARIIATELLCRMRQNDKAVATLLTALRTADMYDDPDPYPDNIRFMVARSARRIGSNAKALLPALRRMRDSSDPLLVATAVEAIAAIEGAN